MSHCSIYVETKATATTEINPLCARMCLTHTCTQCAVGLAVQPNLNESVAFWYDWYWWPFGTGMTKLCARQLSRFKNIKLQAHSWSLHWLHLMLLLIYFPLYISMQLCLENSHWVHSTISECVTPQRHCWISHLCVWSKDSSPKKLVIANNRFIFLLHKQSIHHGLSINSSNSRS